MRNSFFLAAALLACTPAPSPARIADQNLPGGCHSAALRRATNEDVETAYRVFGPESGPPVLLIAGSGMQLVDWPEPFVQALVRSGHHVIAADPRDAGCSSKLDQLGLPDWAGIFAAITAGQPPSTPYSIEDMIADQLAVLDAENLRSVHVVGVSGGAVLAEAMAVAEPGRVRSLTLLMANAGNPARAIPARPDVMANVAQPPPSGSSSDVMVDYLVRLEKTLSPKLAEDEAIIRRSARARLERGYSADGVQRQGAAFVTAGDLREELSAVRVPATIIHGALDPLLPVDAGRDVAEAIPGAEFLLLPHSGHGLDPDMIAAAIGSVSEKTGRKVKR